MISASHTHSGASKLFLIFFHDPIVPEADPEYIEYLVKKIALVFIEAFNNKKAK